MKKKLQSPKKGSKAQTVTAKPTYPLFIFFTGFLTIFLPLFQLSSAQDVTLMPRILALSLFLLIISLLLFANGAQGTKDNAILRNPLFFILLAYLGVSVAAMAFAQVYQESFFDIVKTCLFIGVIASGAIIFQNTPDWDSKLVSWITIAAFLVLTVGVQQYIQYVVQNPIGILPDGRPTIYLVTGRMSHKNEYSNALLLMLPFLAYGIYRRNGVWRLMCAFATAAVLLMIILIKTRAVWVGVLGGAFTVALLSLFFHRQFAIKPLIRYGLMGALGLGITGLIVVFSMDKAADPYSLLGRIQSVIDLNSSNNIHRLNVWKATLQMIGDTFWLGRGPGNWNMEYTPYMMGTFTDLAQTNWRRPHNDFLWVFAEKGIFGITLYLAIFGALFYMAIHTIRKNTQLHLRILALLLTGGIVSYLTIAFFSFPLERINHQVYLGIMAAAVLVLYSQGLPTATLKLNPKWLLGASVLIFAFGTYYGIRGLQQEAHLNNALGSIQTGLFPEAVREANLSRNPFRLLDNNNKPAEYYIAMANERMNKTDEAIQAGEQFLALLPNEPVMLNHMAYLKSLKNDYAGAVFYADKARSIVPTENTFILSSAVYHGENNEVREALEIISQIPNPENDPEVMQLIQEFRQRLAASQPSSQ